MKNLQGLDFNVITDEERSEALISNPVYHAMSPKTKLIWPIVVYPNDQVLTEQQYLKLMKEEIQII